MAVSFSHTLRSLHGDGFRHSVVAIVSLLSLLVLWFLWFFVARITLYETSAAARIEVLSAAHLIESPVQGRVVSEQLQVGAEVRAGDPLVVLETGQETGRIREERAHLEQLQTQLQALAGARTAEIAALPSARSSDQEAIERARANLREAAAAADYARAQLQRLQELRGQGLVSEAELEQANAEAKQRSAESDAADRELARLQWQLELNANERQTRIKEIERQIDEVKGQIAMVEAASDRLDHELAERIIRAPVSGHLGEVAELRPGSVVVTGEQIAVVIPDGGFQVRARFPAGTALGRIRQGQAATVRLEAYPWIAFGELAAEVQRVGSETVDGGFTVELSIEQSSQTGIRLQHGQPGQVAIAVERISPAELLMRAVGKRFQNQRVAAASGDR